MIAHEMNRLEGWRHLHIPRLKACHALLLTRAWGPVPQDLARTGGDGGPDGQGAAARVCMRMPGRHGPRRGRRRRRHTTTRRHSGCCVDGQDHLVITPGTRVELAACRDGRIQGGVPWGLGIPPEMVAPRLERRAGAHPPPGRPGDVRNQRRRHELACPCGAIPRGEAAAQRIWTLAGQPPHGDRDGGGKTRPGPRGQGRPPGHRGAGPASAAPPGERPSAGRRPPAPRGLVHGQRPASG